MQEGMALLLYAHVSIMFVLTPLFHRERRPMKWIEANQRQGTSQIESARLQP